MILVAFADIASLPSHSTGALIAAMPGGMRSYLSSGSLSESARLERICAIGLLCELLEQSGRSRELSIERDKNGRPYLVGRPGLDFNISHSGGMCACILGDSRVGIDLQEEVRSIDTRRLAMRFFTKQEQVAIRRSEDPRTAFFTLWTKKEAIGKQIGDGLVPMLKQNTDLLYAERGLIAWHTVLKKNNPKFLAATCAREVPEIINKEDGFIL